MAGRQRDGLAKGGDGLLDLAQILKGAAFVLVGLGITRHESQCLFQADDGLGGPAALAKRGRQIVVSLGETGLQRDRPPIGGGRLLVARHGL